MITAHCGNNKMSLQKVKAFSQITISQSSINVSTRKTASIKDFFPPASRITLDGEQSPLGNLIDKLELILNLGNFLV